MTFTRSLNTTCTRHVHDMYTTFTRHVQEALTLVWKRQFIALGLYLHDQIPRFLVMDRFYFILNCKEFIGLCLITMLHLRNLMFGPVFESFVTRFQSAFLILLSHTPCTHSTYKLHLHIDVQTPCTH
jgi:hypothetical protein